MDGTSCPARDQIVRAPPVLSSGAAHRGRRRAARARGRSAPRGGGRAARRRPGPAAGLAAAHDQLPADRPAAQGGVVERQLAAAEGPQTGSRRARGAGRASARPTRGGRRRPRRGPGRAAASRGRCRASRTPPARPAPRPAPRRRRSPRAAARAARAHAATPVASGEPGVAQAALGPRARLDPLDGRRVEADAGVDREDPSPRRRSPAGRATASRTAALARSHRPGAARPATAAAASRGPARRRWRCRPAAAPARRARPRGRPATSATVPSPPIVDHHRRALGDGPGGQPPGVARPLGDERPLQPERAPAPARPRRAARREALRGDGVDDQRDGRVMRSSRVSSRRARYAAISPATVTPDVGHRQVAGAGDHHHLRASGSSRASSSDSQGGVKRVVAADDHQHGHAHAAQAPAQVDRAGRPRSRRPGSSGPQASRASRAARAAGAVRVGHEARRSAAPARRRSLAAARHRVVAAPGGGRRWRRSPGRRPAPGRGARHLERRRAAQRVPHQDARAGEVLHGRGHGAPRAARSRAGSPSGCPGRSSATDPSSRALWRAQTR